MIVCSTCREQIKSMEGEGEGAVCELCGRYETCFKVELTPEIACFLAKKARQSISQEQEKKRAEAVQQEKLAFERDRDQIYQKILEAAKKGEFYLRVLVTYSGTEHPVTKKLVAHFAAWNAKARRFDDNYYITLTWSESCLNR